MVYRTVVEICVSISMYIWVFIIFYIFYGSDSISGKIASNQLVMALQLFIYRNSSNISYGYIWYTRKDALQNIPIDFECFVRENMQI